MPNSSLNAEAESYLPALHIEDLGDSFFDLPPDYFPFEDDHAKLIRLEM